MESGILRGGNPKFKEEIDMAKKHDLKKLKAHAKKHCDLPEVVNQFRTKQISRRDFLKTASALGMAASTVYGIVGIAPKAHAATPKKGGTFRMDSPLQELKDPQTFSWIEGSNVTRDICEYLTFYGDDGVVKPYLAESWDVFIRRQVL